MLLAVPIGPYAQTVDAASGRGLVAVDGLAFGGPDGLDVAGTLGRQTPDGLWVFDREDLDDVQVQLSRRPEWDAEAFRAGLQSGRVWSIRGPDEVERVFELRNASNALELRARSLSEGCKRTANVRLCETAAGIPELRSTASLIRAFGAACEEAALDYASYGDCWDSNCASDAFRLAKPFDEHCLASLSGLGALGATERPAIFSKQGGASVLDVTVVLQLKNADGVWGPICGGLLIPQGRLLTARHCVFSADLDRRNALKGGEMRAVRASDGLAFGVVWTPDADRLLTSVSEDHIVLPLAPGSAPAIPLMRFRPVAKAGPAVVLGYFRHYDPARTGNAVDAASDVQAGLRYPKPGLCHVIEEKSGCVRTVCMTVPGYSGAPIFAPRRDDDGALVVYGVVSSAERADSLRCSADRLRRSVVSATDEVSTSASYPFDVTL